jgi:hypothetical protein
MAINTIQTLEVIETKGSSSLFLGLRAQNDK